VFGLGAEAVRSPIYCRPPVFFPVFLLLRWSAPNPPPQPYSPPPLRIERGGLRRQLNGKIITKEEEIDNRFDRGLRDPPLARAPIRRPDPRDSGGDERPEGMVVVPLGAQGVRHRPPRPAPPPALPTAGGRAQAPTATGGGGGGGSSRGVLAVGDPGPEAPVPCLAASRFRHRDMTRLRAPTPS
jgi:hypothetical protein